MSQKHLPSSSLESLAAQWRVLAVMLVAFARHLTRRERAGARGTRDQTEMLDLWVRCALAELTAQIAAARDSDMPLSPQEDRALAHLYAIAASLLMLAVFAAHLKNTIAAPGENRALCHRPAERTCEVPAYINAPRMVGIGPARDYFDTS